MRPDSPQWQSLGAPRNVAEREGLEEVRRLLPDSPVGWGWANLEFADGQGDRPEIDLLMLTSAGLCVVELKSWHGRITGNATTWTITSPRGGRRVADNPISAANQKAKRLRSHLENVARRNGRDPRAVPYVDAAVLMHARKSRFELDDLAADRTYAMPGFDIVGPLI
jgi:hypothetical protein